MEYQFNVKPTSIFEAFSFSFTVPTFVGNGDTPAFTPFTVTMGGSPGFWDFGTAGSTPGFISIPAGEGEFQLQLPGVTYSHRGVPFSTGEVIFALGSGESSGLSGTLDIRDISAVPEPTGIALLSTVIAVGGVENAQAASVPDRPRYNLEKFKRTVRSSINFVTVTGTIATMRTNVGSNAGVVATSTALKGSGGSLTR